MHAQEYDVQGVTSANLEVAIPGDDLASQILLLGAHYDSVQGSPGANDNGTGVAALLELARCLADRRPRRTIRFVAFTNEEPPLFWTRNMGSEVYVRAALRRGDDIRAMISLETLGYYSDAPGSQRYPLFLGWFYPGPRRFHRLRVQCEFTRPARTNRGGVPRRERFSGGTHRRPGVGPGRGLERPAPHSGWRAIRRSW